MTANTPSSKSKKFGKTASGPSIRSDFAKVATEDPRARGRRVEAELAATVYADWEQSDKMERLPSGSLTKKHTYAAQSVRFDGTRWQTKNGVVEERPGKNGNFPKVDFIKGNQAVSLKTVDPRSNNWEHRMKEHISELVKNPPKDAWDNDYEVTLDLRFPRGADADTRALRAYADANGVSLIIGEYD